MEQNYCPKDGAYLIKVADTSLYHEYYYCETCDKIYVETLVEKTEEDFKEMFSTDRYNALKRLALFYKAKETITYDDLVQLGKLTKI